MQPAQIDAQDGDHNWPTFTVVIPLYQKSHRVRDCLFSVQSQSRLPLETIVIDDGSTDGGGDIAKEVGGESITYFRQENLGVSSARNRGLALARGDYVAFLDADDTWRPNHLATLAHLAQKYPNASLLGSGWTEHGVPVTDPVLRTTDLEVTLEFFLNRGANGQHLFVTPAVAAKRENAQGRELFPVGSRIAEDQDAWITLLQLANGARSQLVTADVFSDHISPTMTAPNPRDFESVIFRKWSERSELRSEAFSRFVATHRLLTIQRHIGYASQEFLLKLLLETGSGLLSVRGIGVLLRLFLQSIGLLKYLRALRHRTVS